jgi:organic radical activating enzyme
MIYISVITTDKCNRGCRHCSTMAKATNGSHFTTEMTEKLLSKLGLLRDRVIICYTGGGEPFLNPQMLDILDLAFSYKKLHHVQIVTSGFIKKDPEFEIFSQLLSRKYIQQIEFNFSFNIYNDTFPERLENTLGAFLKSRAYGANIKLVLASRGMKKTHDSLHAVFKKLEIEPFLVNFHDKSFLYAIKSGFYNDEIINPYFYRFARGEAHLYDCLYAFRSKKYGTKVIITRPQPLICEGRAENIKDMTYGSGKCFLFAKKVRRSLEINEKSQWFPSCDCQTQKNMAIGNLDDDIAEILKRKKALSRKLLKIILSDKRTTRRKFHWCELCQNLKYEHFDATGRLGF